ncbi:unnamed protein product [Pseudo-nitzschia multistriata]|uniref:Uncharacterized protein n=1 Tax=Pseudo-nitzschia multistriata TaxID=183589 RepID=A0A448Z557_9STRA|nr:unnamed protein product [Pseudo-nitzschia multistriata]
MSTRTGPYATIPPYNGGRFPPAAAAVPPPGGQSKVEGSGRKAGTANYSEEELVSLMTLIKEILPIGKGDWLMVVHRHGQDWPYGRTKDSIKTKFNRLRRMKVPTAGDPNIPESVRLAREAHRLIGIKANIGNGEETFDPVKGYIDDEDDEDLENALNPGAKSSKNTASMSDSTAIIGDDKQEPIVVTTTPARKRSYGRLKKEITEQDAVLKDYLMQKDKREAERDKNADEREAERVKREDARDEHWLTMAETIAMALAGNINKRQRAGTESHGDSD